MCSTVQTCKSPVGVDEAYYEGNARLTPSRSVDEGCENKFSRLMCRGFCRNGNKENSEGDDRDVQSARDNKRQQPAITV